MTNRQIALKLVMMMRDYPAHEVADAIEAELNKVVNRVQPNIMPPIPLSVVDLSDDDAR
jgi:hypothetical protein